VSCWRRTGIIRFRGTGPPRKNSYLHSPTLVSPWWIQKVSSPHSFPFDVVSVWREVSWGHRPWDPPWIGFNGTTEKLRLHQMQILNRNGHQCYTSNPSWLTAWWYQIFVVAGKTSVWKPRFEPRWTVHRHHVQCERKGRSSPANNIIRYHIQCESKKIPLRVSDIFSFFHFFTNGWEFLVDFFTHLLCAHIFARLQICIQLYPTLMKLCHIKRDCVVHVICSKYPPSAEMHAFRRLRKSLTALLVVACGKSL